MTVAQPTTGYFARLSRVKLSPRSETLLVLCLYIGVAVFMTWPVASQLSTRLAGGRADLMTHQWAFWWVKEAFRQGLDPLYTNLIFYPNGVTLLFHNIAWFNILLWIPLQAVVGSIAAYNVLFIATFALNAFATFLLAREWTKELWPAIIGGLVWGFWPTIQSHYDHPNMIVIFTIPLALLYLKRMMENGRKRDAVLGGIFLGLTGVVRLHLLIMSSVLLGLFVISKLFDRTCRTWQMVRRFILMGLTAGIVLAPFALPVVIGQITRAHPEDIFVDVGEGQTDLLAYVTPLPHHPLSTEATNVVFYHFGVNMTYVAFIGYTTLALALYGLVRRWRQARFWGLVALVYIGIALGPELIIGGQTYPDVPMPYRLVNGIFEILRNPDRFNVILGLPMAMLAAWGVQALLPTLRRVRLRPVLVGLVIAILILIEYRRAPFPSVLPVTPVWFSQLAQEPGQFAILDLPMDLRNANKWYMFYQITHGKPLVEGRISRLPREAFAFMNSSPFLEDLRRSNEMDPSLLDTSRQLDYLSDAGVRYLVMHKRFATPEQLAAWRDWLGIKPYYEDDEVVVYHTALEAGRDFTLSQPLADNLGLVLSSLTFNDILQTEVIHLDTRWGTTTAPDRNYNFCVTLVDAAGEEHRQHCEAPMAEWPTSEWGANAIAHGEYTIPLDPFLGPGDYVVRMSLVDADTGDSEGRSVDLGQLQIPVRQREFAAPPLMHPVGAQWDAAFTLLGYDAQTSPGALMLTVVWQAQQRMTESYKVFVHVVDEASGEIVAQDDSIPRQWSYPTTWWEQNEVVTDTITIPLDQVSPGRYRVTIGAYQADTGQRLPVRAPAGERYPDDVVPLTSIEH